MERLAFTLSYALQATFEVNDLRSMMILGISFIDALSIIGFIVSIVGKVM